MSFILNHAVKNGEFKTNAGYSVIVNKIESDSIFGVVLFDTKNGYHNYSVIWDKNGKPNNLPENEGLYLIPYREIISLEPIPMEERI